MSARGDKTILEWYAMPRTDRAATRAFHEAQSLIRAMKQYDDNKEREQKAKANANRKGKR